MKYSPSIEVVMSLAANEAVAGMFREIEIEHLVMGILKYSEMDLEVLRNVVNLGPTLDLIQEELAELRDILAGRGLNPTKLRRDLRQVRGVGGRPAAPGSIMHRTPGHQTDIPFGRTGRSRPGKDFSDLRSPAQGLP